jgi:hypothetical protein
MGDIQFRNVACSAARGPFAPARFLKRSSGRVATAIKLDNQLFVQTIAVGLVQPAVQVAVKGEESAASRHGLCRSQIDGNGPKRFFRSAQVGDRCATVAR